MVFIVQKTPAVCPIKGRLKHQAKTSPLINILLFHFSKVRHTNHYHLPRLPRAAVQPAAVGGSADARQHPHRLRALATPPEIRLYPAFVRMGLCGGA